MLLGDGPVQLEGAITQRRPHERPRDDQHGEHSTRNENDSLSGREVFKPGSHHGNPTICNRPSTPWSVGFADWILTWNSPPAPTLRASSSSTGTLGA